jgi:monoamine oxidase
MSRISEQLKRHPAAFDLNEPQQIFTTGANPFFRGAYSYVPVNGFRARKALSSPVEETLYFSGEATNADGFSGTVHGAIASGIQTAKVMTKDE